MLWTDLKTEYCSLCDKKFQVGELGEKEDVSVSCTFCGRCFHVINNRLCISQQPIPRKGFLCELCTLKQEKYPEVLEKIIDRCKNHPTIFKYHTSKLTNYWVIYVCFLGKFSFIIDYYLSVIIINTKKLINS